MAEDKPFDASDPKDVSDRKRDSRAFAREREDAMRELMASKSLRKWMWQVLTECHAFSTPFAVDPYITAHQCGLQNAGFRLLAEIGVACPDNYTLMMKENQNGRA